VFFDATEAVKLRLDEAGIGIPYPQRDVHLYEHKAAWYSLRFEYFQCLCYHYVYTAIQKAV